MNKKGLFGETFVEIASLFAIILVLITFWYILAYAPNLKAGQEISQIIGSEEKLTLLNLLRSNINFDINNDGILESVNLADVIVYSYENNNYNAFNGVAKEKLSVLFKDMNCKWSLTVFDDSKIVNSIGSKGDFSAINNEGIARNKRIQSADVSLPVDNKKILTIKYGDNLIESENGSC